MFAQSRFDIGQKVVAPSGDLEHITGVRVTSIHGKFEEHYLLEDEFIWYTLEELLKHKGKQT